VVAQIFKANKLAFSIQIVIEDPGLVQAARVPESPLGC